jgi:putative component of toxin-antitoxin plasmid stabilization module
LTKKKLREFIDWTSSRHNEFTKKEVVDEIYNIVKNDGDIRSCIKGLYDQYEEVDHVMVGEEVNKHGYECWLYKTGQRVFKFGCGVYSQHTIDRVGATQVSWDYKLDLDQKILYKGKDTIEGFVPSAKLYF